MSTTVDEKVVSLKFDNSDFEQKADKSIKSIENLNKAIDFSNHHKGGKGLEALSQTIKSSDLSGMEKSVNTISKRFTNLGIVGVTALQNITNKAVNAGEKLVKSITIDPIKSGFNEYELKMGSMRTILASTRDQFKNEAEAIAVVNQKLNELNEYSDKTIYSFSDMTENIGKFTNAGVDLDTAVQAMKGISNEAAVSGASAAEASRAMYNFSQALSAGYVQLMDWKSIRYANMATEEFKDQLIQTAVATKTLTKHGDVYLTKTGRAITATKGFDESLRDQWLTTEVLTTTLNNYAVDLDNMDKQEIKTYKNKLRRIGYTEKQIKQIEELSRRAYDAASEITTWSKLVDTLQESAQSGWAATFEILFGDINEAKVLWTELGDVLTGVIAKTSDARNDLLQEWKDAGGRAAILNGLANTLKYIGSLLKPIGEAFREVFHPASGKALAVLSLRFEDFTKKLKASKGLLTNIRDTFKGIFSIVGLIKDVFVGLVGAILPATQSAGSFAEIIFSVTGAIGRLISAIIEFVRDLGFINTFFSVARVLTKKIVSVFGSLTKRITSLVNSFSKFATGGVATALSYLSQFARFVTGTFTAAANRMTLIVSAYLIPVFRDFAEKIKHGYDAIVSYIKENEKISTIGRMYKKACNEAGKHVDKLKTKTKQVTVGINIKNTFASVGASIAKVFKSIPTDKIKASFRDLLVSVKGFGIEIGKTIAPVFDTIGNFVKRLNVTGKIATLISFLAEKIKSLTVAVRDGIHPLEQLKSWLDPRNFIDVASAAEGAADSYRAFGGVVSDTNQQISQKPRGSITDWFKNQMNGLKKIFEGNTVAQTIMSFRDKLFKALDELGKGWTDSDTAINRATGIVKIIAGLKLIKQSETLVKGASNIMDSFAGVFKSISGLVASWTAIGTNLGILVKTLNSQIKIQTVKTLALSIGMLVGALYLLGKMKRDELMTGAIAMAAIVGMLIAMMAAIGHASVDDKKIRAFALAIISLGGALTLMALSAKLLSTIDPVSLVKSGAALVAFVGMLALAGRAAEGSLASMVGFIGVSVALSLLVPAILMMSKLSFDTIINAAAAILTFILILRRATKVISKDKTGFAEIVGFAVAMSTMVPAIVVLAAMPIEKSLKAAFTLALILNALAGAVRIASSEKVAANVWMVTAMSTMVVGMTGSLIALALVPFGKLMKSVLALSAVMLSFAAMIKTMDKISVEGKGTVLTVMGIMMTITGLIYLVADLHAEAAAKSLAGLGIFLVSISATMAICSKFEVGSKAALRGLAHVGLAIAALVGVFYALGAIEVLTNSDGIEQGLKKAVVIAGLVGEVIGAFSAGLLTGGLPILGANLTTFMTNIQGFLDGARAIDSEVVEGVSRLASAALALSGAAFINSLNNFFSIGFGNKSGEAMVRLADDMAAFMLRIQVLNFIPIDEEFVGRVNMMADVMEALGNAAQKIPTTGGLKGLLLGSKDLGKFAGQLLGFGFSLTALSNLKLPEGWKKKLLAIADVVGELATSAQKVPTNLTHDSLKSFIVGIQSVSTLASEYAKAAPSLRKIAEGALGDAKKGTIAINATTLSPISAIADVIKDMAIAAAKVPTNLSTDSLKSLLSGTKSIGSLVKGMKSVAKALPDLLSQTEGLDTKSAARISLMADIIKDMAGAAGKINEATGGKKLADGENTRKVLDKLSSFTNKMKEYIPGFKEFAEKAKELKEEDLGKATTVANGLNKVADAAKKVGDAKGKGSPSDLKETFNAMAEGITKYANSIKDLDTDVIAEKSSALASSIKSVNAQLKKKVDAKGSASSAINSYVKGLKSDSAIKSAGTNAAAVRKAAAEALKKTDAFGKAGKKCVEAYANAIKSTKTVTSNGKSLGKAAADAAKGADFKGAGKSGAEGFAAGLRDPDAVQDVASAGTALGNAAYKAAKDAIKSKSPSKKFMELGRYSDEGMAIGLNKYSDLVYKAGRKVGLAGLDGTRDSISDLDIMLTDPHITPVLDLSNVQKGADQINSMLGNSANIDANLMNVTASRQNGGKLEETINKLGNMLRSTVEQTSSGESVNIGDVTLDVSKLEDITTLNDFVGILKMAKTIA